MKKVFALIIAVVMLVTSSISAGAAETVSDANEVKTVQLSEEIANEFYLAALQDTVLPIGVDSGDVDVINGGITAYEDGMVKQTVLVQDNSAKNIGYVSGTAIDYWYRLFDKNRPVCRVSLFCTFYYDGVIAKPEQNDYHLSTYIYSEFDGNVRIDEKSITFTNGSTFSTDGRVDVDYCVYFLTLFDNETISIKCDKNGNLTKYGQEESI